MSTYGVVSEWLVLVGSMVITLGLYSQAGKVWKTHSVNDFTPVIVGAILFNEIVWLNYGVARNLWPVIAVSTANLPAAIAVTIGYYRFRRR